MSQDASTQTKRLQPSPDASPVSAESLGSDVMAAGSFPVESYADRLMDDLFGDVERLLDNGAKPPAEPVRPEPLEPEAYMPRRSSFVDLGASLMRRSEEPPSTADERDDDALLSRDATEQALIQQPFMASAASTRSYDRLLLGVGCLTLLTVLAVWLLNQQAQRQAAPVAVAPTAAKNAAQAPSTTDNQFVSYLQQALKAIDDQQQSASLTSTTTNGVPANLPAVTLPGNPTIQPPPTTGTPTTNTTRPATGLSRLYAPLYPAPQAQPGSPAVAPLPSVNTQTAVRQPIPLSVPGVVKKLVGVLELGDRSAALIEINGVAQRYRIGEGIGSSGWTLVEVSKDQAVIRRNGEVRSVFIGQNF